MMNGVYGNYGWESPRTSGTIELPLVPARRRSGNGCCRGIDWRWFGIVLSLVAAGSLALGVADVVLTYQKYVANKCSDSRCDTNNLVFTWVAVGIWASLPVFILGIFAIRLGKYSAPQRSSWFEILAFLCTFLFAPALIALSVVEIVKGVNIYYWKGINGDDLAKAIIPIVIGFHGIIELLMSLIAFSYLCCCSVNNYYSDTYIERPDTVSRTFMQARKPTGGCQACQGYSVQPRNQVYSVNPLQASTQAHYQATNYGFAPRATTYNYFNRPVDTHGWTHFRG